MRQKLNFLLVAGGLGIALGPTLITAAPTAYACEEDEQRFTRVASPIPASPTGGIPPGPIDPASVNARFISAPNAATSGCGAFKSTPQCGSYQAVEVVWTPAQDSDTPQAMSLVRVSATGESAKFLGPMSQDTAPTLREVGLYSAEGGRIVLEFRNYDAPKPSELQIFLTPIDPQGNVGPTTTAIVVQAMGAV